jgi:hypothetical protein
MFFVCRNPFPKPIENDALNSDRPQRRPGGTGPGPPLMISESVESLHLESCTTGQIGTYWYYQYVPVQHGIRQYENLTVVRTGMYRYIPGDHWQYVH